MLTHLIKLHFFTAITTVVIVLLSLLPVPTPEMAEDVPFFDKWAHFVMYGFLTAVFWVEVILHERCTRTTQSWAWLLSMGFGAPILLGGLMELGQAYLTTTRSGEWMDFYADAFGALLGLLLSLALRKQNKR